MCHDYLLACNRCAICLDEYRDVVDALSDAAGVPPKVREIIPGQRAREITEDLCSTIEANLDWAADGDEGKL